MSGSEFERETIVTETLSATADQMGTRAGTVAAAAQQASSNVENVAALAKELSTAIAEIGRETESAGIVTVKAVQETAASTSTVRGLTAAAERGAALRVSNQVQRRWRSFSRTGVPGDDWPRYTDPERPVLVFDRRTRVEHDPNALRRTAWEGFSLASR